VAGLVTGLNRWASDRLGSAASAVVAFRLLQTNAAGYSQGIAIFIDGGVTSATIIVPTPEPATFFLTLTGLIAISVSAFRRR
jgi:hypothetical protein